MYIYIYIYIYINILKPNTKSNIQSTGETLLRPTEEYIFIAKAIMAVGL